MYKKSYLLVLFFNATNVTACLNIDRLNEMYEQFGGTQLHKLTRPIYVPSRPALFGNSTPAQFDASTDPAYVLKVRQQERIQEAQQLLEAHKVDLMEKDNLGKTAVEHAFFTNPPLFEYLQSQRMNQLIALVNGHRAQTASFFYCLPSDLSEPLSGFLFYNETANTYEKKINDADYLIKQLENSQSYNEIRSTNGVHFKIFIRSAQDDSDWYRLRQELTRALIQGDVRNFQELCFLLKKENKLPLLNYDAPYRNYRPSFGRVEFFNPEMLFMAAAQMSYKSPAIIKTFLDSGARINEKSFNGETPLHRAVWMCHIRPNDKYRFFWAELLTLATVKLLCTAGADLHAKDQLGATPLDRARNRANAPYHEYNHPTTDIVYQSYAFRSFESVVTFLENEEKMQSHRKLTSYPNNKRTADQAFS